MSSHDNLCGASARHSDGVGHTSFYDSLLDDSFKTSPGYFWMFFFFVVYKQRSLPSWSLYLKIHLPLSSIFYKICTSESKNIHYMYDINKARTSNTRLLVAIKGDSSHFLVVCEVCSGTSPKKLRD